MNDLLLSRARPDCLDIPWAAGTGLIWKKGETLFYENPRNRSEYVPADQAAQVQENLQAHVRFETLVASYVEALSARSREERLTGAKKKRPSQISALPRKPKSRI